VSPGIVQILQTDPNGTGQGVSNAGSIQSQANPLPQQSTFDASTNNGLQVHKGGLSQRLQTEGNNNSFINQETIGSEAGGHTLTTGQPSHSLPVNNQNSIEQDDLATIKNKYK